MREEGQYKINKEIACQMVSDVMKTSPAEDRGRKRWLGAEEVAV